MEDEAETNPYQAPSSNTEAVVRPLPDSEALFSIPVTAGKRKFRVVAFEDRLQVHNDDGEVSEVLRHQPMFVRLTASVNAFTVKRQSPKKSFGLIFEADDFKTLCEWIGPPTMADLREALGANSWWQIPVAIVHLIPGPQQLLSTTKAVLLLTYWAGAKYKPNSWWFVPVSLFFFLIFCESAHHAYQTLMANESFPVIGTLFGVVCLLLAWSHFRNFFRYRTLAPPYESFIPATLVDNDGEDTSDSSNC